jgi:NADPH:quinone reductase-like Zn-dependent oxidoreductase
MTVTGRGGSSLPKAVVLTQYVSPDALASRDVPILEPGRARFASVSGPAGVGATDLRIRRGEVRFARPPDAVLGFEAAGLVDALGRPSRGFDRREEKGQPPDGLAGYGQYALASSWTRKVPKLPGAMLPTCQRRRKPQWAF